MQSATQQLPVHRMRASRSIGGGAAMARRTSTAHASASGWRSPKLGMLIGATLGLLLVGALFTGGASARADDISGAPRAAEQGAANQTDGGSGIEGQVSIGPGCPAPTGPDPVCAARLSALTVSILDEGGQTVQQLEPDANGRSRLPLPPGSYVVHPGLGPWINAPEQATVVTSGQFTRVRVVYESGIR
jgi:hypothetical protein